jgi:EF-P beta-lysylation protein EpmB
LPRKADWKQELREAFTQPEALLGSLGLDPRLAAPAAARQFPFLVPRGFARLMVPGDPDDPLLRQVLPLAAELEEHPGYSADPVGDAPSRRATGLLRKYQGRALLLVTGACALHCRYCFRRHFPYARDTLVQDRDQAALALLARDPGITEVVLSGGDPLMLDDEGLAALFNRLTAIPHLRRLRLHTRLPVVLPARITPSLLALLAASRLPIALVIHANHAREVRGEEVHAALSALKATGATLLNQSVLLRGVNAEAASLADLSEALFAAGVLPYYLHRLDPVAGAAHFAVSLAEARAIMAKLRTELPGYLVPKLVRELPGGAYKEPCG